MLRSKWNDEWEIINNKGSAMMAMFSGMAAEKKVVTLPYDAMIHEERDIETPNAAQTGFYPGGQYTYTKKFWVSNEWKNRRNMVEFEGVYQTATIYINGKYVLTNAYGYSEFIVDLDKYIKYEDWNEIKVIADNSAIPNSRWYSGSGIYRDVNLLVGGKTYITPNGIRITTKSCNREYALIDFTTEIKNDSHEEIKQILKLEVLDQGKVIGVDKISFSMLPNSMEEFRQSLLIPNPKLWNVDSPTLYECRITVLESENIIDKAEEKFGIRSMSIDARNGLLINGEETKLRGTCIHHDNGILGASTYEVAEYRKAKLIKKAGFNSIRSSHHPISRAMLRACDEIGILVMDELSDVWNYRKNLHDFATIFNEKWEIEVERMVRKDYNHPSVILYSTGNEIQELGTSEGARLNRRISNLFHKLDDTRYTTVGLNAMMALAFNGKMLEVMQDIAENQQKDSNNKNNDGVNAMNSMMGVMSGEGADLFAKHHILSESIEESELATDVIGLNYLTGRHVLEHELHPNKAVVGTETYPADIARLWDIVMNNKHMLGDFTWTGYDYLGEAGCGIFHYDGGVNFSNIWPERLAYIGDIDLIGCRRPISYYREIVYGLRKKPYIAVERPEHYGKKVVKTAWMFKDNVSSWTWTGFEGKKVKVDVYSDAETVELFLNGKSCGSKKVGEKEAFTATFDIEYYPGTLEAVAYCHGEELKEILVTASENCHMVLKSDKEVLQSGGQDLAFVTIGFEDDNGNENLNIKEDLEVIVSGKGFFEALGSANPSSEEKYDHNRTQTYDGKALLVIRSGDEEGETKVRVISKRYGQKEIVIGG